MIIDVKWTAWLRLQVACCVRILREDILDASPQFLSLIQTFLPPTDPKKTSYTIWSQRPCIMLYIINYNRPYNLIMFVILV